MLIIRSERPEDIEAISEVNKLAFKGEGEAKLVEAIRASDHFVPELSLVAVDGEVVGHILFSRIAIDTGGGYVTTLGLAPMAVMPDSQNKGIGSALVREGLQMCGKLGFEHVVVLGHPGFYPRFGFGPASKKGIKPPFPVAEEAFMACEIKSGSLNGISGVVVYPPAFDHV